MKIKVTNQSKQIIFTLNESDGAKSLYQQLPLETKVENYSNNEKIFYPSKSLATKNTPLLLSGQEGTLGYFSPWKNVVMYYDRCGSYNGLYVLGEAIKGKENIKNLSGTILIEKVENEDE